jgi:UDPglucose 6-dehydrogenase
MIGIIGYGMVGKAVEYGFKNTPIIISDPQYNTTTIKDVLDATPDAIFVCVPTPTDDTNYGLLKGILLELESYTGLTVVKSTILPKHLEGFDVLYNPEFLSRATANNDFVNPPMLIIGGPEDKAKQLLALYKKYSTVMTDNVFLTDIPTASLAKYTMNSFYATKVTFMNSMYDVAQELGVDWNKVIPMLEAQPWMGTHHFQVPGPDKQRGFGGPCLPKDTEALVKEFNVELLASVLSLNTTYRQQKD